MTDELDVSERRACRVVGQHRSTQRRLPTPRSDQENLTQAVINLAEKYGRYGYRRITALLNREGWRVSVGRVYRIWRREGLKVPQKQPKRGRLWLNDGSCVRLRPAHKGHVWSYDFVQDRTHEGKVFRMLCIIDEFTRECLAIRVERRLNSRDVLDELGELFVRHGPPEHIRSDNGPEFIATALREWLERLGTKTLYIEPGMHLGRMGTVRALIANFEMNYWPGRSSMICVKPKCSSKAGGSTTTPTDLILRFAICLQLQ